MSTERTATTACTNPYAAATPSAAVKAVRKGERLLSGRPGTPYGCSALAWASIRRIAVSSSGSSGATTCAASTAAVPASHGALAGPVRTCLGALGPRGAVLGDLRRRPGLTGDLTQALVDDLLDGVVDLLLDPLGDGVLDAGGDGLLDRV